MQPNTKVKNPMQLLSWSLRQAHISLNSGPNKLIFWRNIWQVVAFRRSYISSKSTLLNFCHKISVFMFLYFVNNAKVLTIYWKKISSKCILFAITFRTTRNRRLHLISFSFTIRYIVTFVSFRFSKFGKKKIYNFAIENNYLGYTCWYAQYTLRGLY